MSKPKAEIPSITKDFGKMASKGNKVGTWNLGFGSNMKVKHIEEKKGVKILGKEHK